MEETIAACASRADMYSFLARLYRVEVDAELLDELGKRGLPPTTGDEMIDSGYAGIFGYVADAGENSLTELAIDYVRAFIGNGVNGHSAAYPFESVYVSDKRLLMQDARDEVLAIYRSEGIDRSQSWKVGEDHIALELEFMQMLVRRQAEALEAGNESEAARLLMVQRNFLTHHIVTWVPHMTAEMRRFAKTGFYLGLADLTDGYLAIEQDLVEEMSQ